MLVSAVVCGYTLERSDEIEACVESLLAQTYEPVEIVVVVDGNPALAEFARGRFGDEAPVTIHQNETNRGISFSRTRGAELASGEIVAFIDDDAVAEPDWIECLADTYETTDAVAVGGYVAPDWIEGKPSFFPDEFYWLVGCTERGFAADGEEVRNTYGSNISYRRDAFLEIGGYDVNTGRKGDRHIQAHEAPVGIRLNEAYGRGMIYTEEAVVHHTLYPYRGRFRWLVARAFWQGFSKRVMDVLYPNSSDTEWTYLQQLLKTYLPDRLQRAVRQRSVVQCQQIAAILVFTAAVGLGYVYGVARRDVLREDEA